MVELWRRKPRVGLVHQKKGLKKKENWRCLSFACCSFVVLVWFKTDEEAKSFNQTPQVAEAEWVGVYLCLDKTFCLSVQKVSHWCSRRIYCIKNQQVNSVVFLVFLRVSHLSPYFLPAQFFCVSLTTCFPPCTCLVSVWKLVPPVSSSPGQIE